MKQTYLLLILPAVALACSASHSADTTGAGGSGSTTSGATAGATTTGGTTTGGATTAGATTGGATTATTTGGGTSTANNEVSIVVNGGPTNEIAVDVPYISVTLCVPGTTECQTIPYITVDTGSSGLRVISSVLTLKLPQQNASTGNPLVECMTFADGYTWGSVRQADLKLAGEVASKVSIQVIGDPAFATVPSACSDNGQAEDTVEAFGGNGIIGINQIVADCGEGCPNYFSCSGSSCTQVNVADADQVPNPIAHFAQDNNGAVMTFPTVPAGGAPTSTGTLIFGIGTQANNALGSASVQTVDGEGNFTTVFNGQTLSGSYIDSGTNELSFNDNAIAQCTGEFQGYFCPTSTVNLTAQNVGLNNVKTTVSFSVANTETLFGGSNTAFADLAGAGGGEGGSFAWGFPFFFGRKVFVAIQGASTPGGDGPYYAY